jgi:mono/diheme cytochrome c family protein
VDPDYDADQEYESIEFTESLARIHRFWQQAEYQGVLPETAQPKYSDETIIAGRKAFLRETPGCFKCHGKDFRGQTAWLSHEFIAEQQAKPEAQREKINYDAWGDPAPAADLTARTLHGGRRPIDIYRRIYTGINGTPMPAFNQSLKEEPETIWHLVHYVLSVVEGREVEGLDEITNASGVPCLAGDFFATFLKSPGRTTSSWPVSSPACCPADWSTRNTLTRDHR